eukprot:6460948-Amphidinium_carterae.1
MAAPAIVSNVRLTKGYDCRDGFTAGRELPNYGVVGMDEESNEFRARRWPNETGPEEKPG